MLTCNLRVSWNIFQKQLSNTKMYRYCKSKVPLLTNSTLQENVLRDWCVLGLFRLIAKEQLAVVLSRVLLVDRMRLPLSSLSSRIRSPSISTLIVGMLCVMRLEKWHLLLDSLNVNYMMKNSCEFFIDRGCLSPLWECTGLLSWVLMYLAPTLHLKLPGLYKETIWDFKPICFSSKISDLCICWHG